jgi:hypothetical protein
LHIINGWLILNNKKILFYFRFRLPGVAGVLCADENGLCLAGNFYIFISINQKGILSEHYFPFLIGFTTTYAISVYHH